MIELPIAELDHLRQLIDGHRPGMESLAAVIKDLTDKGAENGKLRRQISKCSQLNSDLESKLDSYETAIDSKHAQCERLVKEVLDLKQQIKALTLDRDYYKSEATHGPFGGPPQ